MTAQVAPPGLGPDDVDMEALRKKYSRPREELMKEVNAKCGVDSSMEKNMTQIIMCQACQAHGTVKKQYGFRVLEEVCEQCDGEGCLIKGQGKKASAELKEKARQVEDLIEACEDLDELEKLEEALKQRTHQALDKVLKDARMAAIDAREARLKAEAEAAEDASESGATPAGMAAWHVEVS